MNCKLNFTGGRKIMNMQKVGTVSQSGKLMQLIERSIESMCRAIHYAYI
jgi:hypothetical protein